MGDDESSAGAPAVHRPRDHRSTRTRSGRDGRPRQPAPEGRRRFIARATIDQPEHDQGAMDGHANPHRKGAGGCSARWATGGHGWARAVSGGNGRAPGARSAVVRQDGQRAGMGGRGRCRAVTGGRRGPGRLLFGKAISVRKRPLDIASVATATATAKGSHRILRTAISVRKRPLDIASVATATATAKGSHRILRTAISLPGLVAGPPWSPLPPSPPLPPSTTPVPPRRLPGLVAGPPWSPLPPSPPLPPSTTPVPPRRLPGAAIVGVRQSATA